MKKPGSWKIFNLPSVMPQRVRMARGSQTAKAAYALLALALVLSGCARTYYIAMEKFGVEKRDILASRIDDTKKAQNEAKEQFKSALEQYRSVVAVDGGDLEQVYDRLNKEYKDSVASAEAVKQRVDAVESVAEDLFREWEREVGEYADAGLRARSKTLLGQTRADYARLMTTMRDAEQTLDPVLRLFNDQVLFLRHNLNARAIGSLEAELESIERATANLIREMERAIDEATRFVSNMQA